MRRRTGKAYRNRQWKDQQACYRGRKFDVDQNESWAEETVMMRIPRSQVPQVMALLESAPPELI